MKRTKNLNIKVKTRVYGRIAASTPGAIWAAGDFADFGSQAAIYKVLQRLSREGALRRVAPGFYDRPRPNRLTGKPFAPSYRMLIDAIARLEKVRMLVDGMTAANDLGLSDAVPGRVIIHTDARIKTIRLGSQLIVFRPTAATKLYWAGRPAMRIVQALHWLKPKIDNPGDRQRIRRRLQVLFNERPYGSLLWRDINEGLGTLPVWMRAFLKDIQSIPPSSKQKSSVSS